MKCGIYCLEPKNIPVWQLPVPNETSQSANAYIRRNVKYHCFVDNISLCGKYTQDTDFYETGIESGEILSRSDIACKICRKRWIHDYNVLG